MPALILASTLMASFIQAAVLVLLTLVLTGGKKLVSWRRIAATAALLTLANAVLAFFILGVLKIPEAFFTAATIGVYLLSMIWLNKVHAVPALIVIALFLVLDGAVRIGLWSLADTFVIRWIRSVPTAEILSLIVTASITWHVYVRNIHWLKSLRFQAKDLLPPVALITFAAVVVLSSQSATSPRAVLKIVTFAAVTLIFSAYFLKTRSYSAATYQIEEQRLQLANIQSLVANLRRQRHDFTNHLNAIYGAAQVHRLDSLDSITKYIEEIDFRLRPTPNLDEINDPIIAGLLAVKSAAAAEGKVTFIFEGAPVLSRIGLKKKEIAAVLGNLLDNALESLGGVIGERRLAITAKHDGDKICLCVANNGPRISEPDRIFEEGYSTRGGGGQRGHGLKIVRDIVVGNHGEIEVQSADGETVFVLRLPGAL